MTTWTVNLLFILPWALMIGLLYLWRYNKKREGRRFPFKDAVLRKPGQGLAERREEMMFDLAINYALIPLPLVFAYAIYLQQIIDNGKQLSWISAVILFASAAAVTVYLISRCIRLVYRMHYCKIGYAGEVAVGTALNELMLQGYHVFHDVQGDGPYNVDHIVVGTAGVFAIETKTKKKVGARLDKSGHGHVYKVTYNQEALYFEDKPDYPHKDFLEQTERGARWVSQWLSNAVGMKVYVQPVLMLPGWYISPYKEGHVMVLNHNNIHEIPNALKEPLHKSTIERIAYQIKQRCVHDGLVPRVLEQGDQN
jgi:Nuclease-related domain